MTPALLAPPVRVAPIEDTTRREFMTGVGTVALAAKSLEACGGNEDDAEATAASSDRFPRTVQQTLGATTIDAEPQHVVALVDRDADMLLSLGVTPVAINSRYGFEDTRTASGGTP